MIETHAVTDDYGRRLYTVTTVQDEPDAPKPKPADAFAAIRARFGEHFDALDPDQLRTVPMPDLRSAAARECDAQARELPRMTYAQRNDAKMDALWTALQALTARVEVLEQAGEVPFAMAEDAWEVG